MRWIGPWLAVTALLLGLGGALAGQQKGWTDSIGERLEWQGVPQRVVSLAPSLTEEVFVLGAGKSLVGDTDYASRPAAARRRTHVGSLQKPSIEVILSLQPDLVLATQDGNSERTVRRLRQLGVRVYTFGESRRFRDVRANFLRLGELLGRERQARTEMAKIDAGLKAITARLQGLKEKRVFLQLGAGSLYTVNGETFLSDVLRHAHARNVMAGLSVRYPEVGRESVLQADPDAILVAMDASPGMKELAAAEWRPFSQLNAVRSGQIFAVSDGLFNLPTPMDFLASVCVAARDLYPSAKLNCDGRWTR